MRPSDPFREEEKTAQRELGTTALLVRDQLFITPLSVTLTVSSLDSPARTIKTGLREFAHSGTADKVKPIRTISDSWSRDWILAANSRLNRSHSGAVRSSTPNPCYRAGGFNWTGSSLELRAAMSRAMKANIITRIGGPESWKFARCRHLGPRAIRCGSECVLVG